MTCHHHGDWVLINSDGNEVETGDMVFTNAEGIAYKVADGVGAPPHKPSSTGRIWVIEAGRTSSTEYFPGVFNCKWVRV